MTHVVKVFNNLVGANFDKVDALFKNAGAKDSGGEVQNNGSWPVPGSTTQYQSVPPGQRGVTYLLAPDRSEYISLLYTTADRKVVYAVQYAKAKNWVQKIGSISESVGIAVAGAALTGGTSLVVAGGVAAAGSGLEQSSNKDVKLAGSVVGIVGGAVGGDVASNLDALDYADTFDSFDFSDAEASTAVSDAQNVDFGLDVPSFDATADTNSLSDPFIDDPSTYTIDYGATPEPSTGFGTNPPDGQFTSDNGSLTSSIAKGIPVAVKAATGPTPQNSQPANQTTQTGKGTNVQAQSGSAIGTTAGGTSQVGSSPALATGVGVLGQIESILSTSQTGQLKPNTGVSANGNTATTNFYLMVGLAFIAAAVLIKGKI